MTKTFTDDKYCHYKFSHIFDTEGFYWYHFQLDFDGNTIELMRSDRLDAVATNVNDDFLQLVIREPSKIDNRFKRGIIYHIFIDRFNKVGDVKARKGLTLTKNWNKPVELEMENGTKVDKICYGGNFKGIIEKLEYLKSLNVGTIYLSPVFEANSSHKYNVADYSVIDSMFGSQEDFEDLIRKANHKGIQVIIDGVFNHTGSDSVYFNKYGRYKTVGAYQSQNSKYYPWYEFKNFPDEYSAWWGIHLLPQTREGSSYTDFIAGKNGIIEKYMAMGVDGMRLDVVDEISNKFLSDICLAARRINPKAMIIGEVWEDASSKISYDERKEYFLGGVLDSVTNYPMKNAILEYAKTGNVDHFVNVVNMIKDQYPQSVQNNLMNVLATHDTKRALTYLGADQNSELYSENIDYRLSELERIIGIKLFQMASVLQYTVMGVPTLFYGDETGIEGMRDPYCRAPYPWGNEDKDLIEFFASLGALRNNKVFEDGQLNIKYAQDGVIIYERVKGDHKVLVATNRNTQEFRFVLERSMTNYFTSQTVSGEIVLPSDTYLVLI